MIEHRIGTSSSAARVHRAFLARSAREIPGLVKSRHARAGQDDDDAAEPGRSATVAPDWLSGINGAIKEVVCLT
jgi:hypothetical protein